MIDLFDPQHRAVPPAGNYIIRFVRHDTVASPTAGVLRRLIAEIVRGPCAGQMVYKPLTNDFRGIAWAEQAVQRLGRSLPRRPLGEQLAACCDILVTLECRARIYHYRHAEGIFPTINTVKPLEP